MYVLNALPRGGPNLAAASILQPVLARYPTRTAPLHPLHKKNSWFQSNCSKHEASGLVAKLL